jgi:hypothetical protein
LKTTAVILKIVREVLEDDCRDLEEPPEVLQDVPPPVILSEGVVWV